MKIFKDLIGNRARDLLPCGALPLAPYMRYLAVHFLLCTARATFLLQRLLHLLQTLSLRKCRNELRNRRVSKCTQLSVRSVRSFRTIQPQYVYLWVQFRNSFRYHILWYSLGTVSGIIFYGKV